MKKHIHLWLALIFISILIIHLSFNFDYDPVFGEFCYAQEGDQTKERIFKEAKETLQRAEAEDVILLSPGNYLKAVESYQKALNAYEAGESSEKIREHLERTIEYIDAGYEKAKDARAVLESLIQTRKEARALEIPERAAYIFSEAESRFSEAAMKVEDGDLQGARSIAKDAEGKYRTAVVEALEKFVLANARERLKNVEGTISKESYRKADAELDSIRRFIQTQGATDFVIGELVAEVNARIQQALAVTQAKPCDLTIEGLSLSPKKPRMGEDAVIRSLVKNVGGGSAEGITVVFLTKNEREVGRATLDSLKPAQTKEVKVTTAVPKLDQYLVIARVDPKNLIAESNERNNEFQQSFAVGPPGSPVWTYIVLSCIVGLALGSGVTFFAVKPRKKVQVAGLGDESPQEVFRITGRVLESDDTPISGAVVKAFDRHLREEVLLSETTTDEEGRYEVEYSAGRLTGVEKKQPVLVIRLHERKREESLPETIQDETADLVLERQEHGKLLQKPAEHIPEAREPSPPEAMSLDSLLSTAQVLARLDVNSWLEFVNTLVPADDNLLIFSMGWTPELQDSLDSGSIPDELRQSYADNELPLSDGAAVSPEEPGKRWLITDDDRTYTVIKEEKLNIYTIRKAPVPRITNSCVGCGDCVAVCPMKVIRLVKGGDRGKKAVIDMDMCISCFCCHEVCKYDGVEPYIPMLWQIYKSRISNQISEPMGKYAEN